MADMCSAVLLSKDIEDLGKVILRCDLVSHDTALRQHYDRRYDTEWWRGHEPSGVPYTPTGPIKKIKAKIRG